jgi:hypothetical protein
VTEALGDLLRVSALSDQERHSGMAQIVESQRLEAGRPNRRQDVPNCSCA